MTDNFTGDFFKLIGKPMLWKTLNYGTIAVHVAGISPNGRVAKLTIDGGEAATPAQHFAELADGIAFGILGQLSKRPTTRKPQPVKELAVSAGLVRRGKAGEIRAQAEMGRVAKWKSLGLPDFSAMSLREVRAYAREHYSTIGKLSGRMALINAIEAQAAKSTEVTF